MSDGLTKYEVSAVAQKAGCAWLHEPLAQRFAALCRAPLVAEVERLKKITWEPPFHNGNSAEHWNKVAVMRYQENCALKAELAALRGSGEAVPKQAVKLYDVLGQTVEVHGYTLPQLLQYGAAQRLAGRERAIEECAAECLSQHENGNYKHDTREDCYDAIRALAASPQEQI